MGAVTPTPGTTLNLPRVLAGAVGLPGFWEAGCLRLFPHPARRPSRDLRLLPDALPKALPRPARFIPLFLSPTGLSPGITASCPVPGATPRPERLPAIPPRLAGCSRQHRRTLPAASPKLSRVPPAILGPPASHRVPSRQPPPEPPGSLGAHPAAPPAPAPPVAARPWPEPPQQQQVPGGAPGAAGEGPGRWGRAPAHHTPCGCPVPAADPPPGVQPSPPHLGVQPLSGLPPYGAQLLVYMGCY